MTRIIAALACLAWIAGSPPAVAESRPALVIATGVDPSFSGYFVAQEGGFFGKHGLDVTINTGPSGSAMIAFVIRNQVQSAFGAEQAGIQDFNLDNDVVVVAEGAQLLRWHGIVGRNLKTLDDLKGKRLGVASGTGSEEFWLAVVAAKQLEPRDYTIVHVEAPEMIAGLERNDLDAYSAWEPWVTRGIHMVSDTRIIQNPDGILAHHVYIYMNRGWIAANPGPAKAFLAALVEATDFIGSHPDEAAGQVSKALKLDRALTTELLPKLRFDVRLDQESVDSLKRSEQQLKDLKKLAKPVDYRKFIYADLLRAIRPEKVTFTLPE
jgi:ABC-type nitrate/sulfonate/bicarbonate transport system substrate-binding protein